MSKKLRATGWVLLAACGAFALEACGGAIADDTSGRADEAPPGSLESALTVSFAGTPAIAGVDLRSDGRTRRADEKGQFTVRKDSQITLVAGGIELATIAAKSTVTLFDLVSDHHCESGPELARVASVLFALNTGPSDAQISLPPAHGRLLTKLDDLSDTELLALEMASAGKSVPLEDALLRLNHLLDAEAWSENLAARETWANDFPELSGYLQRVISSLANGGQNAPMAFGSATLNEIFADPTAFRSQGLSYDGDHVVFSSRYGLQITDQTYLPLKTVPWAIPQDIFQAQIAGAASPFNPDFTVNTSHDFDGLSHIGDVDLYGGKVYAPIEDENVDPSQNAFIALFDAKSLSYTGEKHQLPRDKSTAGVPWVAIDAARKLAYTSEWDPIAVLHVWDLETFTLVKDVPLIAPSDPSTSAPVTLKRIQGAKVYHGMLYASADTKETDDPRLNTKTKRVWKIDPVTGYVSQLFTYAMPNRSEAEGIAMSDREEGQMHVLVLGPYDAAYSDSGFELAGDDWNTDSTLRHYQRTTVSLRDMLCSE